MRELFFALGVLFLLRFNNISGWWNWPLILFVLALDYYLLRQKIKSEGELEAMRIYLNNKKN